MEAGGIRGREQLLDELRPLAFRVAYRMLGSVSEAEDIVQEALLRVHQALDRGERIASPQAFVTTIATRLAIDELRSARARRELYVGEWLPEPIVTAEDNARQLASRPRRHVAAQRPRFRTTPEHPDELVRRFFAAAENGDLSELEALLADDVVLTGDGGGKAPALARSLTGRSRVAAVLRNWSTARARIAHGINFHVVEVNGGPGALALDVENRVMAALAIEIADGQITRVMSVVNPDKLAHIGEVVNLGELLRGGIASDRGAISDR